MNRKLLAAALVLMAGLAASMMYAQTGTITSLSGKVVSIDAPNQSFVMETADGRVTVKTMTTTSYMGRGAAMSVDSLKVGDQVSITSSDTGMTRTASQVNVTTQAGSSAYPADANTTSYQNTTSNPTRPMTGTAVTGRVVAVDRTGNLVTIQTTEGPVVYRVDSSARWTRAGSDVQWNMIRVNDQVTLTGATRSDMDTTDSDRYAASDLPHTGSSLPALGLAATLLLGLAAALRNPRPAGH
jgi:hypothetical protein